MKSNRLSLADFKLKKDQSQNDVSKLMGNVLGNCHDGPQTETVISYEGWGASKVPVDAREVVVQQ